LRKVSTKNKRESEMKIIDYKEVIAEVANMEGAKGVKVR